MLKHISFAILIAAVLTPPASANEKYVKAFPKAGAGMERYIIILPHKTRAEEKGYRVELFVGKKIMTDGVNAYSMGGAILPKPLKGWGFTYYEVPKLGGIASTLVGVPPGTPKVEKFVAMKPLKIRYNSRIPVVVYVPQGGEVRYRIWKAPEKLEIAKKR